jgi:antitoxin component of MazEF toxin-antitoxin module
MTDKNKSPKKEKKSKKQGVEDKKKSKYTLEELVAQITEENTHPEIFADAPVGKERFWLDDDSPF